MMKRMVIWMMVVAMLATALPAMAAKWQKIDAQSVKEKMDHGNPLVVFSLSQIEYNNLHIKGSVNIPVSKMADLLPADKDRELIFYCLGIKCTASPKAADTAVGLGYKNVYAFVEGLPAWISAGYPTESIERLPLASIRKVSPSKLKGKLDADSSVILIDIRQDHDLAKGVIDYDNILRIPLDDLIERIGEVPKDADIVVACHKGKRGPTAVRYLSGKGYKKVTCLEGGVKKWKEAGLPIAKK